MIADQKKIYDLEECLELFEFLDQIEVEYRKLCMRFGKTVHVPRGHGFARFAHFGCFDHFDCFDHSDILYIFAVSAVSRAFIPFLPFLRFYLFLSYMSI